ncbi:P-II family nitrogen regulator, partial [Prosthecobacter sp.]
MKLVTIICEAVLEERIVEVLHECGAHGHTAFDVRGSGRQGQRSADLVESGNVQI